MEWVQHLPTASWPTLAGLRLVCWIPPLTCTQEAGPKAIREKWPSLNLPGSPRLTNLLPPSIAAGSVSRAADVKVGLDR